MGGNGDGGVVVSRGGRGWWLDGEGRQFRQVVSMPLRRGAGRASGVVGGEQEL